MRDCSTASSGWHRSDTTQALAEHEGLVHWVVQRQWLGELPYAEALHQGRIALWRALRGYDPRYPMRSNGHDYARRRTKWCCEQVCLTGQAVPVGLDPPHPPPDCPYQAPRQPHGQIINVGRTLPDGNLRLAREVPYGTVNWKKRYGRRNLSESRKGSLESMGLKRLPNFGRPRNQREIAIADFVVNLHTPGRLVQEATTLALKAAA